SHARVVSLCKPLPALMASPSPEMRASCSMTPGPSCALGHKSRELQKFHSPRASRLFRQPTHTALIRPLLEDLTMRITTPAFLIALAWLAPSQALAADIRVG